MPHVSETLGCDSIFLKLLIRIKKLRKDRLSEEIFGFKRIYLYKMHSFDLALRYDVEWSPWNSYICLLGARMA